MAERLPPGSVIVSETGDGRFTQQVRAGIHSLLADEPPEAGGADLGPNPYDLLLASLGACTAMTIRLYAERKHWPLRHVEVRLRHGKIHAEDCQSCETSAGLVDVIVRELVLVGELDESQRQRLADIAGKCPVHRTLTGEVRIVTREA